jgi:hypothetical protein
MVNILRAIKCAIVGFLTILYCLSFVLEIFFKKAEQGITEKLNERHGKENVVVVKINKNGSQFPFAQLQCYPLVVDLVFRCCLARLKVHLVNFHWAFYCCLAQLVCSFQVQWLV